MKFKVIILVGILSLQAVGSVLPVDETEYLAVFMQGKKVGHAIHSRKIINKQVITSEEVYLTITRMNVPISITMIETSTETPAGEPIGFESVQNMSIMQMQMVGKVKPNGTIEVTTITGTNKQVRSIEWPEGAVMAEGLRLIEEKHGLKEGTQYKVKVFVPSMLQALEAEIIVGPKKEVDLLGRIVKLTEVTSKMNMFMAGEVVTTSYVDDDLRALKTITPVMEMNMEMVACSKEFALADNESLEVFDKAFISSPEPIENVSEAESITYYLKPTGDANNLKIESTDYQKVNMNKDGQLIVTVKPLKAPENVRFPYRGNKREALEALKPNRFIQSDDEKIIKLAKQAVGNAKDAMAAAERIESFVGDYIETKDLSIGYATAVEVAQSKQGDCSEHAILTAALCQAVGIPAEVVVGIAYVDDFEGLRGFGPHAWTQAYIGDRWVGLDSAFKGTGRGGYDAGHITLATGAGRPEDFAKMIFSMGQFEIEKVEVEK
ncbi:MAG: transglutaminase-like domain-containing protein [Phycisphaerales bacterium]